MSPVSPAWVISFWNSGGRRALVRTLAAEISALGILEAVARSQITPEEGVLIFTLKREAEPWPLRFLRWLFAWW